jgi:hypothetical protein
MTEYRVLMGQGWLHNVRLDPETVVSEPLVGWLISIDGGPARAMAITRTSEAGAVWHPDAGEFELPEHVAAALDVTPQENLTITRRTSRWPG